MVEGFKHTEVGLIPEDWELPALDTISKVIDPHPSHRAPKIDHSGIPFVGIGDLDKEGNIIGKKLRLVPNEIFYEHQKRYNLKDNLIGLGRVASIGKVVKLKDTVDPYTISPTLGIIKPESVDYNYLVQILKTDFVEDQFKKVMSGSTRSSVGMIVLRLLLIPLPPTKTEQTAIATALNDTDALITALEKLIAKKKAIKQGAMQELLRPKEGWIEKNLGKSATLKARIGWQGLTTAEYKETGEYFLITGTDFKNGFIDWQNCVYVEKLRYDQDNNIQIKPNDVLVTKDGTIGKVAFINEVPKPATLNSGVFVIRPIGNSFHPKFFYYILLSEHFAKFLGQLSAGSTINHLYQKDFVSFDFWTPKTIDEQKEISEILFDMDSEIEELEQKLAKQKQIKQGMMQVLLTGKIRLV